MQRIWLWSFLVILSLACAFCLLPVLLFFYSSRIVFFSYDFVALTLLFTLLVSLSLFRILSVSRRRHLKKTNSFAIKTASENSFFAETLNHFVRKLDADRKAADQRAETAEELSRRVIEGLPSGLLVFDACGLIRLSNPVIYNLFGFSEPLEGISYCKAFEDLPSLRKLLRETIVNGKTFRSETIEFNRNSTRRQMGVTVAPLETCSRNTSGALCLLTDITEINEIREQLAVKQNLANLGEMAAGITHEFKNSLAAIQTYAQFWQTTETDTSRKKAAQSLLNEVKNLSDTVLAFLDFARPQKLTLSDAPTKNLVFEAVRESNHLLTEQKISISIRGDFVNIKCDEILLTRVFINLLKNAAECFPAEQTNRNILITGERTFDPNKRSWQWIKFQDSGAGIKEEHLPFLFVPFFSTKPDGHGVGLALAQRIIAEHGGSLAAENNPAGGAAFICKLPISSETFS